jgi:putative FmdB family regulatory protein
MPNFEYRCRDCGAKLERIVYAGKSAASCKQCGSARGDQLLSVFAVVATAASAAAEPGPCGACGPPRHVRRMTV